MIRDTHAPSFAFMVLTYNHENYILEHLESVKHLINAYGKNIDADIIISDDCSSDKTCFLIDNWLDINKKLFRNIDKIYNSSNLGTCKSLINILDRLKADKCKITAGDDVYSYENIFELSDFNHDVAIVSGRTLFLYENKLKFDRVANILTSASQIIYERDSMLHRFKHFSYNNAPNILYSKKCLIDSEVITHLKNFDVIEDWPLQIAIARKFPDLKFKLLEEVLVYYRRTIGSIYLVANERFNNDKLKIYNDLIKKEKNLLEKIRLISRRICFKLNNKILNKFFNLDFYFFGFAFLLKVFKIYDIETNSLISQDLHQRHYHKIHTKAFKMRMLICK